MVNREKEILDKVIEILKNFTNPTKIILFGFRAKDNKKNHANFDIAVDYCVKPFVA